MIGQGAKDLNQKNVDLDKTLGRKFFTMRMGEALAPTAQRSCECPIPRGAQVQVGRGSGQPEGGHGRGLLLDGFFFFQPKPSHDYMIIQK